MFSNHLMQLVHLKNPQFPKVFTNFENQIGKYSIAHKEAKEDFTIIKKIVKNKYNYILIIQYNESKIFDIIKMTNCRNISESYGYAIENCIPSLRDGDIVKKGTPIYHSHDYDNNLNFSYGTNLKAVYCCYNGLTFEDGIVISKSGAEKLTSYKVEETEISVNTNDIMLNIYGDENNYKSFPKVGDHITSKVLLAMRRIDGNKILYDFQDARMREIDSLNDTIFYTDGGEVVDISFFSNISLEELKKRNNKFSNELVSELENEIRFNKEIALELEKIIPIRPKTDEEIESIKKGFYVPVMPIETEKNKNKYSDDLAYLWKTSHEYIDENIRWREDGKSFENLKIKFTILKENPLVEGCKITGRYGNKGVISQVVDDSEMPITEDGERAEICLNPLGVINRLNLSQIQEQYINFMSDHLVKWMKEHTTNKEREEEFFKYISILNQEQSEFLKDKYNKKNDEEKREFFEKIINEGIYIHQKPFFGNPGMEEFKKLFIEMPELCTEYKFVNIERPMVMGDLYFIRLKHESSNKSSIRSTSMTNIRNLPAKNTLKKDKKTLFASTPIRLGKVSILPSINSENCGKLLNI